MKTLILVLASFLAFKIITCEALDFPSFLTMSEHNRTEANKIIYETYLWTTTVTQNNSDTIKWYEKEANAGNPEAQFGLATMFFKGIGQPKNLYQAAQWYKASADQGYSESQFLLGYMYLHGLGVPQNKRVASDWLLKAAAQGDANAQFNVATLFFSGEGIPEHFARGLKWYAAAAAQGHIYAQNMLGTVYNHGIGTDPNKVNAYIWWAMANTSSKLKVRDKLDELQEAMTTDELRTAQETAAQCYQSKFKQCQPTLLQTASI
ncbi:MAG: tetratricopeptide repeat protein [Porticoccaceae bacterium]|nr:tetratricopeptide repeat protein [Porticoccaceae bacterium]